MNAAMNVEELVFDDITPVSVPVRIAGKDYVLRETTGDASCKWRNALLAATKLGSDGKPTSLSGMADSEPLLVSLCLFEVYDQGGERKERSVPLGVVRAWPYRLVKALFNRAKQISHLDEEQESEEALLSRMEADRGKLRALQQAASTGAPREDPSKNGREPSTAGSG